MRYIDALINRLLEKCSGIIAPSLLSVSCDSKVLTWQDNSDNEAGFSIERSGDDYVFSEIDTVAADVVTYTDSTADPMVSYFYRVRAFNAAGSYSAYSNVVPCEGDVIEAIKYGLLYNWYAGFDERNICAEGWGLPTTTELTDFVLGICSGTRYVDDDGPGNDAVSTVGGEAKKLRAIGDFWEANEESTDIKGFHAVGAGFRTDYTGQFNWFKETCFLLSKSTHPLYPYLSIGLTITAGVSGNPSSSYFEGYVYSDSYEQKCGVSIRPVKDSTSLLEGQTGVYTGNDGKTYLTVCIGGKEWLACNLAETKYRNGDSIPEVTDNAAWAALTTGAMCAYNNDWDNV